MLYFIHDFHKAVQTFKSGHIWDMLLTAVILEQEPGGVNLAEKVTNFDMASNDLHI